MVSFAALEEELFEETGVAVNLRRSIGNGKFMGYNYGRNIEVLAPEAMSKVDGVSNSMAAARYTALHEKGHDEVSDKNPKEHARMDVGVINRLARMGDYAAVNEAINIHEARARNATGKDREFSKYALALLAGQNMDGGSEVSLFKQRYGGGLGKNEKHEKYPWIGDTSKFWPMVGFAIKGYAANFVKDLIKNNPEKGWKIATQIVDSYVKRCDKGVETAWNTISPKGAGIVDMYDGASNLDVVYTVDWPGTNYELPIYFQRKKEKLPDDFDGLLKDRIRHAKKEMESPYNDEDLKEYFRDGYNEPGFPVQTWGDVPDNCIDPVRPKKWAVREESEVYAQKGPQLEVRYLDVDGETYTIRKMGEPSGMNKFFHCASYWAMYGLTNFLGWGTAKKSMMEFSPEFGQWGIESQMKGIYRILKPFEEVSTRPDYEFDLKWAA